MKRIENPSLEWHKEQPRSQEFADVYFNPLNGLEEARTVFIGGNDLPRRWMDQKQFTIAETGFGTGLNFLATWESFEQTAPKDARLDFISFERYPLAIEDLKRALLLWRKMIPEFFIDRLLKIYPSRTAGFHQRWISDRVTLTLVFDDALRGIKQLECPIDAWYLDGFSPKRNAQLWQPEIFDQMARLSYRGTTMASFTAAGDVRRGLKQAGFTVKRHDGFGYKYHRITGIFENGAEKKQTSPPKKITIVGAGIAGASLHLALTRRGIACEVIEQNASPASGASGNRLGLINPKIEAQDNPRTDIGLSAFSFATHILSEHGVDYRSQGALHLAFNEEKRNKLEKIFESGDFLAPHVQWIKAKETQELCGIALPHDGLYYRDAATVNSFETVQSILQKATIRKEKYSQDSSNKTPHVLCTGWELDNLKLFPLQPVRGQVLYVQAPQDLRCPVMFGSYCAPMDENTWSLGATFEPNNADPETKESDDAKIIEAVTRMTGIAPPQIISRWGNVRTATRDRFPIVGVLPDRENTYVLGALGSHGLQFGLLLAEILACLLTDAPLPAGRDAVNTVLASRFWKHQ